jgi:hypothetical protein
MKILQKFARQVAAIDESLLNECPQADKNWANHIGYALMLTFIVVFGLVFYSLLTIDGAKIIYDVQTNAVKMETNSHEVWSYVSFGVVAVVIALILFLFDRAFYQSDWFSHSPYGQEMSLWKKLKTVVSKIARMSVRIGISLILAYALSTFAELKFYESELLTTMQKEHLKENEVIYTNLKTTIQNLDDEVPFLRKKETQLLKKLQNIENGVVSMDDEPAIKSLLSQADKLYTIYKNKLNDLKGNYAQENKRLIEEQKHLEGTLSHLTQEHNNAENYYLAEVNGIKEIVIDGKVIKASGKPTEGKRAKMHKAHGEQISKKMKQVEKKLVPIKSKIKDLEMEYKQSKKELELSYAKEVDKIEQEKKEYHNQMLKNLQVNAKEVKKQYALQLQRVQNRLEDLTQHKDEIIEKEYQKMMQSPEYIPFRDGPMSRVMALKKLENDPQYGEDVSLVSWIVRGFIIFLEAIPIFSKMWFGPQTLYATLLQMRLKRMTQEAIDNKGMTLGDIERAIKLEKKKQELHDIRMQTWVSDVFEEDIIKDGKKQMYKAMHEFEMNTNGKTV